MNSFKVTAIGNLAKNPELIAKDETIYSRFCLIGNDYAGRDDEGTAREVVTSLWFVAFGALGEAIAKNARKGDQLIVDARIRANNWIDRGKLRQHTDTSLLRQRKWRYVAVCIAADRGAGGAAGLPDTRARSRNSMVHGKWAAIHPAG